MIEVETPERTTPSEVETEHLSRRRWLLRWVTGLSAIASGVLVGVPSLRALLSPAFKREAAERWTRVGDAATIELGVPVKIDFSDTVKDGWLVTRVVRSVWLYTTDGQRFIAYNPRCTHLGCGYGYDADTKTFRCPCHEGRFNVQTGARIAGPPPRSLDQLKVKVENGMVYVAYQDFRLGVPEAVAV
jgi:quinol---cytochrome c reductase iron-sulfur subunit, bacillus type